MGRKNVFLYDIDVPEIVQEKAEEAFSMIKAEGENRMKEQRTDKKNSKKMHKKNYTVGIILGAAACAAVVIMMGRFVWNRDTVEIAEVEPEVGGIPVEDSDGTPDGGEKEEGNDLLSAIDNMFTLQVMAAELEEGQSVPLVDSAPSSGNDSQISGNQASSWVLGGTEDGGVDYCIQFPVSCTGNNIEKITYSINNGAFQIVQPLDESIIVDGQPYNGALNVGQIGGTWNEETGEEERPCEVLLYQSFTVDYQRQTGEDTWINICNELSGRKDLCDLIWGEENTLEEVNQGMQGMFENTVITCTVHYTDGTTQTADILVNSRIMTCAEAGVEAKEDPDRKESFITFERQ